MIPEPPLLALQQHNHLLDCLRLAQSGFAIGMSSDDDILTRARKYAEFTGALSPLADAEPTRPAWQPPDWAQRIACDLANAGMVRPGTDLSRMAAMFRDAGAAQKE